MVSIGKILNIAIYCSLIFILSSCVHVREATYLDVYQGEPIVFEEMLGSLSKARIIYLGETHTLKRHHRFQLRVIQALYEKHISLTIGLEMLPFTCQGYLDAWGRGELEKKEFLRLIDWEGNWGFDFDLYEPLFEIAREQGIPLRALNAPPALVKKVARNGLSGLTNEEKGMLSPIIPSSDAHRNYLKLSLSRHKILKGEAEQYAYEAQDVWDSTMAHSVVEYLKSDGGKNKTMVVLAGSGHLAYGYGIPEKVTQALDLPYRILYPSESGDTEFQEEWEKYVEPFEVTHEDLLFLKKPIADFIFLVPLR
jgi:uncharacterized iron-regulated protein